jgi:hypothetical protein
MNFNLHLDDQTAKELDRTAKKPGETRSGLIRKALREWLDKKTLGSPGGPSLILERQGVPDMPPFESYRGSVRKRPALRRNQLDASENAQYADHRFEGTGHPAFLQIWKERQR